MIDRIMFFPADASATLNDEEVLDLLWVFAHDITCDIPSKSRRWAELCHASQNDGDKVVLKLGARDCPLRFASSMQGAGMFEFHVIATAENADTVDSIVRVKWNGTVAGLDIE